MSEETLGMQSLKKWLRTSSRKTRVQDAKDTAQRTAGQSVKQNLDRSHIENEEEKEVEK